MLSRLNKSDLHKIVLKHDRIYAIDSPIGALIVSRDGGRTFSEQFTPSGVLITDFEVDPGDPRRIVVASDAEVFRSADGGATWMRIGSASGSRFAWPARDALYRAVKDGSVQRSADGGMSWKTVGRIDGEPYRMKAVSREELYVVIGDGTILHTRDGGRSWEEAFRLRRSRGSVRRGVQRAQLVAIGARRDVIELGALGGGVGAAVERGLVDAEVAQPGCLRAAREVGGERDERRRARGSAPLQRDERVGQHDGVGRAVADAGEARERLRQDVVQAVAGAVDRVARQQRGERERVAVGSASAGGGSPS